MIDKWMLAQDNDSHWYCIPVRMHGMFSVMSDVIDDGDLDKDPYEAFNMEFGRYAVGGSYSLIEFENPTMDGKSFPPGVKP